VDASAELALQPDASRFTLPRFLEDVIERHGGRPALRDERGAWTFDELGDESRRIGRGLLSAGLSPGGRVAVLMANRREWVSSVFGASLAGAVCIPVNTFGTPDELDYILQHGDVEFLLMQSSLLSHRYLDDLLARHPEIVQGEPGELACAALPKLRRIFAFSDGAGSCAAGAVEDWEALESQRGAAELETRAQAVCPDDDGLIIYTSGTTARPKGVLHRQAAAVIQSWRFAEYMALSPEDRVWTAQPFFWTAGICMSLGASLAAGAELVLQDRFEAESALDCIERTRPTTLHAWPHQEKAMAEHPSAAARDLSSLSKIEFGSAMSSLAGLEEDVWGTYGSYGCSETFTICSALPAWAPPGDRAETSGVPLPGMELRILDTETGEPLPQGEKGEIAVRGITLMRGYVKVDDSLVLDGEGFFRTQDGGFIDERGHLHWTGRLSNLLKTGGANVSPLEIEAALGRFPGLTAAVAVGVPHPTLGEAIVVCGVLSGEGAEPTQEAVLDELRPKLAAYKLPRAVLFFNPDEVDLTGNQKIQVESMRERARERLAAERIEIAGTVYEA